MQPFGANEKQRQRRTEAAFQSQKTTGFHSNQKTIPLRVLVDLLQNPTHLVRVRFLSEIFGQNLCPALGLVLVCVAGTTGCAVSMAIEQPTKKNLAVLETGTPRALVVAEFGRPVASRTVKKRRVDSYRFVQGYSTGNRAGRALLHGAADMATIGLWEVAAMPAEGYFSGENFACEVLYDDQDRVLRWRAVEPEPRLPPDSPKRADSKAHDAGTAPKR